MTVKMTVSVNGVWWIWATATQTLFRAKHTQQSQELNVPTIRRLADESLVCTLPTFILPTGLECHANKKLCLCLDLFLNVV